MSAGEKNDILLTIKRQKSPGNILERLTELTLNQLVVHDGIVANEIQTSGLPANWKDEL